MTLALIAIAAILIGARAFRALHTWWVIRRSTSGRTEVVVTQLPCDAGAIQVDVRVLTPQRRITVVEVEVARPFSEAVHSARPDGFRYDPHVQDGEPDEPDSIAARWDAQWVRYTGELAVGAATPARVTVPVDPVATGAGEIRIRYVEEVGVDGVFMGFEVVRVTLGSAKGPGAAALLPGIDGERLNALSDALEDAERIRSLRPLD
jgi:hypothetical protein